MTENKIVKAVQWLTMDYDERADHQVAITATKLRAASDILKVTSEEISHVYITHGYLTADALMKRKVIERQLEAMGIGAEEYRLRLDMHAQTYLNAMARMLQDGMEMLADKAVQSI